MDERLLTIVGGEDGDLVRGVAHQTHEAVQARHVLRLAQVLGKVRGRLALALKMEGGVDG